MHDLGRLLAERPPWNQKSAIQDDLRGRLSGSQAQSWRLLGLWTFFPKFGNVDEGREFRASHESSEYLEWERAKRVIFPKLKPSTKTISLRLPESLLDGLKLLGNKQDIPYQLLLKIFLAERVKHEWAG